MKELPSNEMIADALSRKVFAERGNRSKAHMSEVELAAWIKDALDTRDLFDALNQNAAYAEASHD